MQFLLIGLNYLPESTSIGPYTADLAQYLQAAGHQVRVITGFPMAPQWKVWDGYRDRWFMRETINGILILRTYLYVPSQPKKVSQRVLFDLSFALSSFVGGIFAGQADLIAVISPPLQLGLTGWLLGLLKRVPFFIYIQDLVPDAAVVTGMMREDSLATRLARAIERFVYKQAKGIGVISEGFVSNLLAKGVPAEKVLLLPNSIDLQFLKMSERNNGFRREQNISPDEFVVMYSGSVALKQGLHTFVKAATEFAPGAGVSFYLVGEGPYLEDLKILAEKLKVSTLHFLPLQTRELLSIQLSAADVLVITQRQAVTDMVFPGKLLYYMAAARPILAAVSPNSETGRFINEHQVGLVVPPENPSALAEAIGFLRNNQLESERLGKNGRRVVEDVFDREFVMKRYINHLEELAQPV
jgi:colanic acid biosynthesis glycosyl transferase WcaI